MAYAEATAKIGVVDANAGYYKFKDLKKAGGTADIWTVGLGLDVAKDLKFTGSYIRSDADKAVVDTGISNKRNVFFISIPPDALHNAEYRYILT